MEKKWFVFYTKSRQEKKVHELLTRSGKEVFLPLQNVVRQWSDRKKKVEVPLFNSYIFVRTFDHTIQEILQIPGVAWNIRHNGKPAILREEEYQLINRFLTSGYFVESGSIEREIFEKGDRARIVDGPLKNIEGSIYGKADQHSFFVALEGIDQVIKAEIPTSLLKKLN